MGTASRRRTVGRSECCRVERRRPVRALQLTAPARASAATQKTYRLGKMGGCIKVTAASLRAHETRRHGTRRARPSHGRGAVDAATALRPPPAATTDAEVSRETPPSRAGSRPRRRRPRNQKKKTRARDEPSAKARQEAAAAKAAAYEKARAEEIARRDRRSDSRPSDPRYRAASLRRRPTPWGRNVYGCRPRPPCRAGAFSSRFARGSAMAGRPNDVPCSGGRRPTQRG